MFDSSLEKRILVWKTLISSCYQHIKFPRHLPVTWVQGRNLVSNPPVGNFISSLWFGNIYFIQIIYFRIFDCLLIVQLVSKHLS